MIYRSDAGFLADHSLDEGDGAMRAGIAEITGMSSEPLHLYEAPFKTGLFRRSPIDFPWTSTGNFTRDQMLPLVAAMGKRGMYSTIRRFFWQRAKQLFFMQNFERDVPGSTKYPWPHKVKPYSESNPNQPEVTRSFDFADPLLPHHIWHIIKAGKMYEFYWFAIIALPFFFLDMMVHGMSKSKDEENQMFSMAYVQGKWALKLYKKYWFNEEVSKRYWGSRNEIEYHEAIMEVLNDQ